MASGPLLSLGGLEPDAFRNTNQIVRRSQIVAMMNGLARKTGDAGIGFKMAQTTDPSLLGPVGKSLLVGRTLGEALSLQWRHMPWLQRGICISMETIGQRFQWTHRISGCDPAETRFLTEGIAAFFVRFVRAATGDDDARLHVILPHKPAAPLSAYEDALRCAVTFEKGTDLVVSFDAVLLDLRNVLRTEDADMSSAAADDLVPAGFDLSDDQLMACLRRMIEVAALWGRLTLADAARTLGLSSRSLQRRLARLDMPFERLVDDWRRDQALRLLALSGSTTADIAARLGYADPSHFIRAFRRWQGASPTDFRRDLAQNGN